MATRRLFVQQITIRKAKVTDSTEISSLISRNAQSLLSDDFEDDGLAFFLNAVSERSIRDYMEQGFRYLVALERHEIVGVIAIKDYRHMFHLFVDKAYHKKGIAKLLWDTISRDSIEQEKIDKFTLNSTSYALPVYRRWGFNIAGERQTMHGISFTPMVLIVE